MKLFTPIACIAFALLLAPVAAPAAPGALVQDAPAKASFEFSGTVGDRIQANIDNWLLRAPGANPGMIGMFRVRDREPVPALVPWAGEFVGKYLISAIQALRMSNDSRLQDQVAATIEELIATQADDGYLGPFPKKDRLLGNWDLWGHYHIMLALAMWHERTGDEAALDAARRAADLVCATYLNTSRRVIDAGSTEMNMAVIHGLGRLYRATREEPYLKLMREIEKDWRRAGDYYQTGANGVPYYRIPSPRWESLHDLQGLVELYRITGEERYRDAFLSHWRSIRAWDRRNSGAFSSGEQATGHPYAETAIETCCTIAWMAITIDALQLTGDSRIADELELSTYNAAMGAQHPSGNWWTYNTPMDGAREASAHTIVFQARAGTPDLNCCSVNGPRALGMLSEWAVTVGKGPIEPIVTINYLGPMVARVKLPDGTPITIRQESSYPLEGKITTRLEMPKKTEMRFEIRIPLWAGAAKVSIPGAETQGFPGRYFGATTGWNPGDTITTSFDIPLRAESGDEEQLGRVSLYRGPLLLAYDQRFNVFDEGAIPSVSVASLGNAVSIPVDARSVPDGSRFAPWLLVDLPTEGGKPLRVCDYASAGALGTRYRSWLPSAAAPPPPPVCDLPNDGAAVPQGRILFKWRRPPASAAASRKHRLEIYDDPIFGRPILSAEATEPDRLILDQASEGKLKPATEYYWKLVATDANGAAESSPFYKRFRIDPSVPPLAEADLSEYGENADGLLLDDPLAGEAKPSYGELESAKGAQPAAGPGEKPAAAVATDGKGGMIVYKVRRFPEADCSLSVWINLAGKPAHLAEIFSAWAHGGDDPLRVCVDGGKVYARVEGAGNHSTEGAPIEPGKWFHVAVVKREGTLYLYLNGEPAGKTPVPRELFSSSTAVALGGNPRFTGDEYLAARFAGFKLFARALSEGEVKALAAAK